MASSDKLITLAVVAGGAFALYEFLKSQCSTVGSGLYGNAAICPMIGIPVAAPVVAPVMTTSSTGSSAVSAGSGSSTGSSSNSSSSSGPLMQTAAQWNTQLGAAFTPTQLTTLFPNPTAMMTQAQFMTQGNIAGSSGVASLSGQLQSLAGSNSLNADGWNYYFNSLLGAPLSGAQFQSAFPAITATDRGPTMTAQQFVAALLNAGITAPSGYGMNGLGDDVGMRLDHYRGRSFNWQPHGLIPVDLPVTPGGPAIPAEYIHGGYR